MEQGQSRDQTQEQSDKGAMGQLLNAQLLSETTAAAPLENAEIGMRQGVPQRSHIEARTLKGFRDLLPAEAERKGEMLHILETVFRSFGYPRIETPHLEYSEALLGKAGAEINKQVYRFRDHGDRDVSLRFDLTVPFARFVVQHKNELGLPFRRYAIGNVFRGENTQAGRYREFTQCDFDIVGAKSFHNSCAADAEIVQVMVESLEKLGLTQFNVHMNNRKIFNGMCEFLGVAEHTTAILRSVDKIGKIGAGNVAAELEGTGLATTQISQILQLISLSEGKTSKETIEALAQYRSLSPALAQGIEELENTVGILEAVPKVRSRYLVDLSIARGLGYYTGVVFETFIVGQERFGSVCSGGRYADLTSAFSTEQMPGVGASVGIDRLIAVLDEVSHVKHAQTPATVLVMLENETHIGAAHVVAAELRGAGLQVETFPQVERAGPQFNYAKRRGHAFVVRPSEEGTWIVSTMADGTRTTVQNIEQLRALVGMDRS